MKSTPVFALLLTVMVGSGSVSAAADSSERRAAMNEIRVTTKELCSIPLEGYRSEIEVKAQAEAKLAGLIKKLSDLGIEGSTTYRSGKSRSAVVASEIVPAMRERNTCVLHIFDKLLDRFLPEIAPTPKAEVDTQELAKAASLTYLEPRQLQLGMTRSAFISSMEEHEVEWSATDEGLVAKVEQSYDSVDTVGHYYFKSDRLYQVLYANKVSFTKGDFTSEGYTKAVDYANRLTPGKLQQTCERWMAIPSRMLAKLGEPAAPERRERVDYHDMTQQESECQSPEVTCTSQGEFNNFGDRITVKFKLANGVRATVFVEKFVRGYQRRISSTRYERTGWSGCRHELTFRRQG